jgi:hypothetical protein
MRSVSSSCACLKNARELLPDAAVFFITKKSSAMADAALKRWDAGKVLGEKREYDLHLDAEHVPAHRNVPTKLHHSPNMM